MKTQILLKIFALNLLLLCVTSLSAQTVLIEAESFKTKGGWVVDQQFMEEMGSPYLLAHGLGTPVADASTAITLPTTGKYRVWVRTKDWVAQWNKKGAPGKFKIEINTVTLDTIFGTKYAEWSWQDGGTITINQVDATLKLKDLTGYEGRCDAIVLTKNLTFVPPFEANALAIWRNSYLNNAVARDAGKFDLVVVGGGIAGVTACVSAARLGLKVAMIQDRPVVGGNNSTEVRVMLGGATKVKPFTKLGKIVDELKVPANPLYPPKNGGDSIFNDDIRMKMLLAESNITLFLNYRANGLTMNKTNVKSVIAQNTETAERIEVFGTYFSDCTGDGTIGTLAGADFEVIMTGHMGNSNLWNLKQYATPQPFPRCPWALDLTPIKFPGRPGITGAYSTKGIDALGGWYWESGFSKDPLKQVEYVRDYNFLAMYGAWDCVKNVDSIYPNYRLNWAAYVTGKRESRRLMGDILLTKEDCLGSTKFPDGFVGIGWNMDVHIPNTKYSKGFEGEEFISHDVQTSFPRPFYIPYRCMYSRNVSNLFMAGRNISVTQAALGTVRVMQTTGMMGELVGMAAFVANQKKVLPREVYTNHLDVLTAVVYAGIPAHGDTLSIVVTPLPPKDTTVMITPNENNTKIIIDNTDIECTFDSAWSSSKYNPGYYGSNYVTDGNVNTDSTRWAKWTPQITKAGKYRIYMRWTSGTNRPDAAPVIIQHADSITHKTVDQVNTKYNGIWYYLGEYKLNIGTESYVKLLATDAGHTIADAVLFEQMPSTTGIEDGQFVETQFYAFTNKADGVQQLVVDLSKEADVKLELFTLSGSLCKTIVNNKLDADRYYFPVKQDELNKGFYLAKLTINGKTAGCKKIAL